MGYTASITWNIDTRHMWNLGVWTLDDLEGKFKIEVSCEVALGEQQADQSGDGAL